MSTFRAFQTGLMAGQQQAKVRSEQEARMEAAEAFKTGNYEGAISPLMRVGLMQDADAYTQAGERKKEADRTKTYADAFKTGLSAGGPAQAATATMEAAGSQGDIKTVAALDQFIANSDERSKKAFADSMSFFGSTAIQLKNVPPEARGQAAMEILQNSPFNNPQILAQIQQAAADGRITDDELDAFALQTMSAGDRVKQSMDQARLEETKRHNQAMEQKKPGDGIQLQFGEGGTLSGLSIGGTGTKGKEAAVIRGPGGQPVVSPSNQQLVQNKSWQALQNYQAQNNIVLQDIDRALSKADMWTTGLVGAAVKNVPGTPAFDLAQTVNTIKANIGFDKLQAMRDASPTGGALGQVSEQENKLLQSVLGALETSQSGDQFKFNLTRLKSILADSEGRKKAAFVQDYPDLAQYAGFAAEAKSAGDTQNTRKRVRDKKTGEEYDVILQNGQWVKAQ